MYIQQKHSNSFKKTKTLEIVEQKHTADKYFIEMFFKSKHRGMKDLQKT